VARLEQQEVGSCGAARGGEPAAAAACRGSAAARQARVAHGWMRVAAQLHDTEEGGCDGERRGTTRQESG
jgi:hypothetical protein